MAPATAVVALRATAPALALAFGYFVGFASVSRVGRPEVSIVAPPVAELVKIALNVGIRILLLTDAADAANFLVHVT